MARLTEKDGLWVPAPTLETPGRSPGFIKSKVTAPIGRIMR